MTASPYNAPGHNHLAEWESRFCQCAYVYVLREDGDGPIKVGSARDVYARIDSLQTGNPRPLHLLYVLPAADRRLEWFMHRELKGSRMKGEWFKPGPVVDRFLELVADLSERMLDAYVEYSHETPHYADIDPDRFSTPGKRHNPVTVRWVEPDPKMPTEEAKRLRESVRNVPDVFASPHPIARSRTPGRAPNGGHRGA